MRLEMNRAAVQELLQSDEVQADLERRGRAIADTAGEGMEVEARTGATRARVSVVTGTPDAMIAEATDRRLTQALDSGRD